MHLTDKQLYHAAQVHYLRLEDQILFHVKTYVDFSGTTVMDLQFVSGTEYALSVELLALYLCFYTIDETEDTDKTQFATNKKVIFDFHFYFQV